MIGKTQEQIERENMDLIRRNIRLNSTGMFDLEYFLDGFQLKLDEVKDGIIGLGKLGRCNLDLICCSNINEEFSLNFNPYLELYVHFDNIHEMAPEHYAEEVKKRNEDFQYSDRVLSKYVYHMGGSTEGAIIQENPGIFVLRYKSPWTYACTQFLKRGIMELHSHFEDSKEEGKTK